MPTGFTSVENFGWAMTDFGSEVSFYRNLGTPKVFFYGVIYASKSLITSGHIASESKGRSKQATNNNVLSGKFLQW